MEALQKETYSEVPNKLTKFGISGEFVDLFILEQKKKNQVIECENRIIVEWSKHVIINKYKSNYW